MALSTDTFNDFGGAVQDIFGAVGSEAAASAYTTASKINQSNAVISESSARLNAQLTERNTLQTLGTSAASTVATGFELSGSAGDIMRYQAQQGALAKSLIQGQGELQAQSFAAQAAAERGQASASKAQAGGGFLGGLLKVGAGIFGL